MVVTVFSNRTFSTGHRTARRTGDWRFDRPASAITLEFVCYASQPKRSVISCTTLSGLLDLHVGPY